MPVHRAAVVLLGTVSGRIANSGYGNRLVRRASEAGDHAAGLGVRSRLDPPLHPPRPRRGPDPPRPGARGRGLALALFVVQLLLNYAWSPIFFAYHEVGAAFWTILAMIADLGRHGRPVLADPPLRRAC